MVYRIAYSILKNEADSEDIYQETFIKFYKNIEQMKNEQHEKAWLIRVTINNCNMLLRRRKIRKEEEITEELPDTKEENGDVLQVVNKLPTKYRIVIYLYYYEGYKIFEISKILNDSEGTIKSRLSRAREYLEKMIKEDN